MTSRAAGQMWQPQGQMPPPQRRPGDHRIHGHPPHEPGMSKSNGFDQHPSTGLSSLTHPSTQQQQQRHHTSKSSKDREPQDRESKSKKSNKHNSVQPASLFEYAGRNNQGPSPNQGYGANMNQRFGQDQPSNHSSAQSVGYTRNNGSELLGQALGAQMNHQQQDFTRRRGPLTQPAQQQERLLAYPNGPPAQNSPLTDPLSTTLYVARFMAIAQSIREYFEAESKNGLPSKFRRKRQTCHASKVKYDPTAVPMVPLIDDRDRQLLFSMIQDRPDAVNRHQVFAKILLSHMHQLLMAEYVGIQKSYSKFGYILTGTKHVFTFFLELYDHFLQTSPEFINSDLVTGQCERDLSYEMPHPFNNQLEAEKVALEAQLTDLQAKSESLDEFIAQLRISKEQRAQKLTHTQLQLDVLNGNGKTEENARFTARQLNRASLAQARADVLAEQTGTGGARPIGLATPSSIRALRRDEETIVDNLDKDEIKTIYGDLHGKYTDLLKRRQEKLNSAAYAQMLSMSQQAQAQAGQAQNHAGMAPQRDHPQGQQKIQTNGQSRTSHLQDTNRLSLMDQTASFDLLGSAPTLPPQASSGVMAKGSALQGQGQGQGVYTPAPSSFQHTTKSANKAVFNEKVTGPISLLDFIVQSLDETTSNLTESITAMNNIDQQVSYITECRKPIPGLVEKISQEHGLSLSMSSTSTHASTMNNGTTPMTSNNNINVPPAQLSLATNPPYFGGAQSGFGMNLNSNGLTNHQNKVSTNNFTSTTSTSTANNNFNNNNFGNLGNFNHNHNNYAHNLHDEPYSVDSTPKPTSSSIQYRAKPGQHAPFGSVQMHDELSRDSSGHSPHGLEHYQTDPRFFHHFSKDDSSPSDSRAYAEYMASISASASPSNHNDKFAGIHSVHHPLLPSITSANYRFSGPDGQEGGAPIDASTLSKLPFPTHSNITLQKAGPSMTTHPNPAPPQPSNLMNPPNFTNSQSQTMGGKNDQDDFFATRNLNQMAGMMPNRRNPQNATAINSASRLSAAQPPTQFKSSYPSMIPHSITMSNQTQSFSNHNINPPTMNDNPTTTQNFNTNQAPQHSQHGRGFSHELNQYNHLFQTMQMAPQPPPSAQQQQQQQQPRPQLSSHMTHSQHSQSQDHGVLSTPNLHHANSTTMRFQHHQQQQQQRANNLGSTGNEPTTALTSAFQNFAQSTTKKKRR